MILGRKQHAWLLLILDFVLGALVLWAISTGDVFANETNQKHFIVIILLTIWLGWLGLYYLDNLLIIAITHPVIAWMRVLMKPFYQLLEQLNRNLWRGILVSLWLGYGALNIVLEKRLEPRVFDTEGYITDFSPRQVWTVANRPITVSLFYKLLGNDIYRIEVMQYIASIIGWTILAVAIVHILETRLLKFMAWLIILVFSVNRELFFWHSMLLSESLSHSLLAAGLGFGILAVEYGYHHAGDLTRRRQLFLAIGLTLWLFLWSQTRDANSYAVLTLAVLLLIFVVYQRFQRQSSLFLPTILVMSCMVIFAGQTIHANRGQRWHIPYLNILGERILPNEDNTAYFMERGMPYNERVSQYAGQRAWAFQPEHDLRYEINDWLNDKGRTVYFEYLATHPFETLTAPIIHWQQLLAYNYSLAFLGYMENDADVPAWLHAYSCAVYWDDIATCGITRAPNPEHKLTAFFPLVMTLNALVMAWLASITYGWDRRQLYPLLMLFFMYVLGFVTWHGDADSIERHAVQVNILWRLSLWFAVLFALDWIFVHYFHRKQSN